MMNINPLNKSHIDLVKNIDASVQEHVETVQKKVETTDAFELAMQVAKSRKLPVDQLFAHLKIEQTTSIEVIQTRLQTLSNFMGSMGDQTLTINNVTLNFQQSIEVLLVFQHACRCACCHTKPVELPSSKVKPRKLEVSFAAYGVFVQPQRPVSRDPLVIRLTGLLPGASLQVRDRSFGFGHERLPQWAKLDIGDLSFEVDPRTGAAEIVLLDDTLRKLGLQPGHQVEIRQITSDGRYSDEGLLPLSDEPRGVQLSEMPAGMKRIEIGSARVSGAFHGIEDLTNPKVSPNKLEKHFEGGKLEVNVNRPPHREFAQFCEPRANVQLWNINTGAKSDPVKVNDDGTFTIDVKGDRHDSYAMLVTDQSGKFGSVEDVTVVPLAGPELDGFVLDNPSVTVIDAPFGLDLDGFSSHSGGFEIHHGVPQGAVVELYDAEMDKTVRMVADPNGCVSLPADVYKNRVYSMTIESPHVAGMDDEAVKRINPRLRTEFNFTVESGKRGYKVSVLEDSVRGTVYRAGAKEAPGASRESGYQHLEGFTLRNASQVNQRNSFGNNGPIISLSFEKDPHLERRSGHFHAFGASMQASPDGNLMQVRLTPTPVTGTWLPKEIEVTASGVNDTPINGARFPERRPNDTTPFVMELIAPDGKVAQRATFEPHWQPVADSGFQLKGWNLKSVDKVDEVVAPLPVQEAQSNYSVSVVSANMIAINPEADPKSVNKELTEAVDQGRTVGSPRLYLHLGNIADNAQKVRIVNLTGQEYGDGSCTLEKSLKGTMVDNPMGRGSGDVALFTLQAKDIATLAVNSGDTLEVQVQLDDGAWSRKVTSIVKSDAKKTAITVNDVFVSGGSVSGHWTQKTIGHVPKTRIYEIRDGKAVSREIVATPIPQRAAAKSWIDAIEFEEVNNGDQKLIVGRLPAGTIPPHQMRGVDCRRYTLNNPYGNGGLYATTSSSIALQKQFDNSLAFVFDAPRDQGVFYLRLADEDMVYPPKMAKHPAVLKSYPDLTQNARSSKK